MPKDNVTNLSARKNTSGLSDAEEEALYQRAIVAWQWICENEGLIYQQPNSFVVLPRGDEYEVQIANTHGDLAYFVTYGGTAGALRRWR